ncbi:MAG: rod shape-determining protein MreC [Bacteroidota bacterium]|nr:rod shape-determining protein MreC [Bacteroidota bacterium]
MQRILTLLIEFKEYFILTLLVLFSIILLTLNDNPQLKAIRSYTVATIGIIQNTLAMVPNIFELQRENEVLRKLNVTLLDEVSRLREAKLENTRLRELLGLKEKIKYKFVAADVIGKTLHLQRNTITLNVGRNNGVNVDMPVVSEQGIAGRIVAVSSNYSIAQLLLNKDFRTSVKIQRSRVDGILGWDGSDRLMIKNVSKKQDVKVGDAAITSEYSKIFPPDIKVGVVISVDENPVTLFKDILIEPSVDFTRLEQVFVITSTVDTQRVNLESKFMERKK